MVLNVGGTPRLIRGAVAGAIAWWVMDQMLQGIYDRQCAAVRERETRARGGIPALEMLAERLAALAGLPLPTREREMAGTIVQWAMGIGGGVIYAALREHVPGRGLPRGLVYGAAFSLAVDETLTPLLALAPGPGAFPWQTHARGFVGHLVFGAAAELVLETFEAPP